jgi:competence protein ComEC
MKSIRSLPFLKLLIPLLFGIVLGNYVVTSTWHYYFLCYLLSLVIFYLFHVFRASSIKSIYLKAIALFLHVLCLGIFISTLHSSRFTKEAKVVKASVFQLIDNWTQNKDQYTVQARVVGSTQENNVLIRLKSAKPPEGKSGDYLHCNKLAYAIQEAQNPMQFDYKEYMNKQNIAYTLYLKEGEYICSSESSFRIHDFFSELKEKMISTLNSMPLNKQSNAFIKALLLGDKSSLDPSTKKAFSIAGATHVLAVSGLHVGIIVSLFSALFSFLLGKMKKEKAAWIKSIFLLVIIWIYAGITNFSPSILRASIMFSFLSIGLSMTRHSNIYNTLSIAAFFMLILNPDNLYSVGFQLSFLAVSGIVYFYPKINRILYFKNKLLQKGWSLCSVSIAAQLTTFPLALYYFHQFPSYFLLSNLVVIPAAFIVLLLSILLLSFSWISLVAEMLSFILNQLISALHFCIHFIEKLPFSSVQNVYISLTQLYLSLSAVLIISFYLNTRKVRYLSFAILLCSFFFAAKIRHRLIEHRKFQVLVYSIPHQTAIHVIEDAKHAFILNDNKKDLLDKLSYASSAFSQFKGLSSIDEAAKIKLGEPATLISPFLLSSTNHLIIRNTLFCINHSSHKIKTSLPFSNRIIFYNQALSIDEYYTSESTHIIDNDWKQYYNKNDKPSEEAISYHVIKNDGYFLLTLND